MKCLACGAETIDCCLLCPSGCGPDHKNPESPPARGEEVSVWKARTTSRAYLWIAIVFFLFTAAAMLYGHPLMAALPVIPAVYFLAAYMFDRSQYELTNHRWIETAGVLKPKTRVADLGRVYHVVETPGAFGRGAVSLGTDLDEFGADGIEQPEKVAEMIRVHVRKRWEHEPRAI